VSVEDFAFQACSFNHSDISPSLESTTCSCDSTGENPELCQTLQCLGITYGHLSIAAEESAEPSTLIVCMTWAANLAFRPQTDRPLASAHPTRRGA